MKPLVAVTCLILSEGLLCILFLLRPSSVLRLSSKAESEDGVGSASHNVTQAIVRSNKSWEEWKEQEKRATLSRFEEVVLLDMKHKLDGMEERTRNTSMLLENLRLWLDSELRLNHEKFTNGSKKNVGSELTNPAEKYSPTRINKPPNVQTGFVTDVSDKIPVHGPHLQVPVRPLNPLEEYFLTVRDKVVEIRRGPVVNPLEFPYVINPGYKTCAGQRVFLIAFVLTALDHYDFRRVIRKTWATTSDYRVPVRCVFVVGRSHAGNADQIQKLLELESKNFGDIVQSDFIDTYKNLTYKTLLGMRWAATYCPEAKYVLKVDDDTFVNMFALVGRLEQDQTISPSTSLKIFGRVIYHDVVHRKGKWAVQESEFRPMFYPQYCSGPAYVMTMTLAAQVVRDSLHVPFFHFEDVYVTGFVTMLSGYNVHFVQWDKVFVYERSLPMAFVSRYRNQYLFAIQVSRSHTYANAWHQMKQLYVSNTMQAADAQLQMRNKSFQAPQPKFRKI